MIGTEFLVTKHGSGEQFCVHYMFLKNIKTMRNPFGEQVRHNHDILIMMMMISRSIVI